jgi:hypothetical protein
MVSSLEAKESVPDVQVFISYRSETGSELARLVWDALKRRGYTAFIAVEDLRSGPFNKALYNKIEDSSDMVLILTPNSLDRCQQEGDWVRLEVAYALKRKKNIVPVMAPGFQWPPPGFLPPDLADLPNLHGVTHSIDLFEASMDKLKLLLIAKPAESAEPAKPPIIKWLVLTAIIAVACVCIVLFGLLNRSGSGTNTQIPSPNPVTEASSPNPVTEAREYFDRKDYAGAFHAYSIASDADLQDAALHRKIEDCARLGHLEKQFLERYLNLVAQYPQQKVLHYYLGNAYLMLDPQDKDGKAKQQHEIALNSDINANTKITSPLDEAADYANRGYLEQARKLVTEVLKSDPGNEKAKTLLSEIDGRIKSKNENDKKNESKKLWY